MFIPNVIQKPPSIPSLADIMPYLMDAPLISLQTTSRQMYTLGYDILNQRDEELKNILSSHYFVLQSYRVNPYKDQNVFCIGETHGSESCQKAQVKFIHFLAKRWPVIVVLESLPVLKTFTKAEAEAENEKAPISLIAKRLNASENIHYLGWDDATSVEEIKKAKAKLEEQLPYKQAAETLLSSLKSEIQTIQKELSLCCDKAHDMAAVLGLKKIIEFPEQHLYVLHMKSVLGETHLEEQQQLLDLFNVRAAKAVTFFEITKACNQLEEYLLFYSDYFYLSGVLPYEEAVLLPILERTYQARTEKMVMTLSKIHEYILENPMLKGARVVLIAGSGHFQVLKNSPISYNLDLFYEEIEKHEAAILMPKN